MKKTDKVYKQKKHKHKQKNQKKQNKQKNQKKKSLTISFKMDASLKSKADEILEEIGLTMPTAFIMLVKSIVRFGGLPFDLTTDPFYSKENIDEIKRRIDDYESGKTKGQQVVYDEYEDAEELEKYLEELDAMRR